MLRAQNFRQSIGNFRPLRRARHPGAAVPMRLIKSGPLYAQIRRAVRLSIDVFGVSGFWSSVSGLPHLLHWIIPRRLRLPFHAQLAEDVILAIERMVAREAVDHEAAGRRWIYFYGQRAVGGRVTRPGCQDAIALCFAAQCLTDP